MVGVDLAQTAPVGITGIIRTLHYQREAALQNTLNLPIELQSMIGKYLNEAELVFAVNRGLRADKLTMFHAYIWAFIFNEHLVEAYQAIQNSGNFFLLGSDLHQLFEGFESTESHSRTNLLLSLPKFMNFPRTLRSLGGYRILPHNISLESQQVDAHSRIVVDEVGRYLRYENGKIWTTVLYFRGNGPSLHKVNVNFRHSYEEGRSSVYKYVFDTENLREGFWGDSRTRETIWLEDKTGNNVKNPRRPWHLAIGSNPHHDDHKSWWEELVKSTKSRGRFRPWLSGSRGWWEYTVYNEDQVD